MLTAPTLEQLHALKLAAMATAWTEPQHQADLTTLAFDERFGLLVEAEWRARENKRLTRALQEAKLKITQACIEAIDYPARRELDKAVIRQLATCRWVEEHQNVILVGATGVGKSFIACALAHQACRKGYRAGYRRASRLFHELALARADGTYMRLLAKLARLDVLVVDDWGLAQSRIPSVATSSKSWRIATASARASSRASFRRPIGTTTSARRPWPTRSATACCTTLTGSCYKDPRGERRRSSKTDRRPRVASLRSRSADRADHDRPI
jgi:hypothetical protein